MQNHKSEKLNSFVVQGFATSSFQYLGGDVSCTSLLLPPPHHSSSPDTNKTPLPAWLPTWAPLTAPPQGDQKSNLKKQSLKKPKEVANFLWQGFWLSQEPVRSCSLGRGCRMWLRKGAAERVLCVKTFMWTSCVDYLLESANLHVQNSIVMLFQSFQWSK